MNDLGGYRVLIALLLESYLERKPMKSSYFLSFFRIFERRLSVVRFGPQAAAHLLDGRDFYPGFAGSGVVFVILTQSSAASQPGDGPLHNQQ